MLRSITVIVFYIVQDKESHVLGLVHWKYRDITFRILWIPIKMHIDPLETKTTVIKKNDKREHLCDDDDGYDEDEDYFVTCMIWITEIYLQ